MLLNDEHRPTTAFLMPVEKESPIEHMKTCVEEAVTELRDEELRRFIKNHVKKNIETDAKHEENLRIKKGLTFLMNSELFTIGGQPYVFKKENLILKKALRGILGKTSY